MADDSQSIHASEHLQFHARSQKNSSACSSMPVHRARSPFNIARDTNDVCNQILQLFFLFFFEGRRVWWTYRRADDPSPHAVSNRGALQWELGFFLPSLLLFCEWIFKVWDPCALSLSLSVLWNSMTAAELQTDLTWAHTQERRRNGDYHDPWLPD